MNLESRCVAAMVLSGVGDALGYKNGDWEFNFDGEEILKQVKDLGGVKEIRTSGWMVSDDTVMHLATAEAIMEWYEKCITNKIELYKTLVIHYEKSMGDMTGRAPGNTSVSSLSKPNSKKKDGFRIDFNPRSIGCGAAMRAMCIGIRFHSPEDLQNLIEVSVESGRITHHHPTGYLGSLAAALFTSYALEGRHVYEWGKGLMDTLEEAKKYIKKSKEFVKENKDAWDYFEKKWDDYLKKREIRDGSSSPKFDSPYGPKERDQFYKSVSFSGWGGSSGHDAPMIAYDAFLGMYQYQDDVDHRWEELCKRGMFHGGDSDSTGTMAACWYGAIYGYEGVPKNNYENIEYKERLEKAGEMLYQYSISKARCQKEDTTKDRRGNEQEDTAGGYDHENRDGGASKQEDKAGDGNHGNRDRGASKQEDKAGDGDHGNRDRGASKQEDTAGDGDRVNRDRGTSKQEDKAGDASKGNKANEQADSGTESNMQLDDDSENPQNEEGKEK